MSTSIDRHLNSALPISIPYKSTYYKQARKTLNTKIPDLPLSLVLSKENSAASPDSLPSGASFLLEIHRRREKSTFPSEKMTRKEGLYIETDAHPLRNMPNMHSRTKLASPSQKMTKKERDSLIESALNLMLED